MSGGVDSSVAAFLSREDGMDCVGVTLKLFQNDDVGASRADACCSLADAEDARRVSYALGLPHYVFDFSEDFRENVIDRFVRAYREGRTPNPCIDCNRYIKFHRLLQRMHAMAFDRIVTGHYARICRDDAGGRWLLKTARDAGKDQSYVLYAMTQAQLSHTRFPLGELHKSQVRAIAAQLDFVNARKRDSQDICFVQTGGYADFIEAYTGAPCPPGDFVDTEGRVLGRHRGIIRYTIGQRKGLHLALPAPLYVCAKHPADNTVTLAENDALYKRALDARAINLIPFDRISQPIRARAKTRYNQQAQPATVWQTDDDALHVEFDAPQRAIAPGQALVLYGDEVVLGGGTIL